MPLPDADPDKRMYKLLKNIDLENLTFEQFQSTAQTVFAEPESEDTLRRIVLINLSRMAVAGDWNGLTTSGGGDAFTWQNTADYNAASGYGGEFWNIAIQAPICSNAAATTVNHTSEYVFYNPFVAPFTGAPSACNINVTVATTSQNLYVGFFSGTNGIPATMLGYATISTDSTGVQRVTSFTEASTGSLTFTAGQMYYYSINKSGTDDPTLSVASVNGSMGQVFSAQAALVTSNQVLGVQSDSALTTAPADVSPDDLWNGGSGWSARIYVWLES